VVMLSPWKATDYLFWSDVLFIWFLSGPLNPNDSDSLTHKETKMADNHTLVSADCPPFLVGHKPINSPTNYQTEPPHKSSRSSVDNQTSHTPWFFQFEQATRLSSPR